jgi:hypothetical protein
MKFKITLMLFGLVVLAITSCKKEFDLDINDDPNNPNLEQLTPKLVFPAAVVSSASRIGGDLSIVGSIWAQYYTQGTTAGQYKNIDAFDLSKTFGNTNRGVAWIELFAGALNDYHFIINKSKASKDWNYYLMATVMKAYTYQVLVDLYDQVPYTEAFQGAENLQPRFDDGYTVYKGLLAEIDTALNKDFNASTNTSPGPTDFVFPDTDANWTVDPWIQFANTLKLKLYLRMRYAKPTEAEAGIKKLYADGVEFLDQDAKLDAYEDASDKRNPLYTYAFLETSSDNLRASYTFLSWLQANNDPRIDDYFAKDANNPPNPTGYLAIHQGDYDNQAAVLNGASKAIVLPTDPVDFITLAESHFLQAEALEKYFNGAGAKAHYDAGVTAAFARYGENAASFIAPAGKYVYPTGGFEEKLEAIIVQKWASFARTHGIEGFFERNRTGYPKTSPVYSTNAAYIPGQFVYPKAGVTNGLFATRLIFPDLETSKNANAPADELITKRVWWDVQ